MFSTQEIIHQTQWDTTIAKPKQFTYPFSYEPHPWVKQAAKEVQDYLSNSTEIDYAFGFDNQSVGKMFGVIIVENAQGKLGYLAAFSGKINDQNRLPGFVPPVFDVLNPKGFFKKGEAQLNQLNQKIKKLENDVALQAAKVILDDVKRQFEDDLKSLKLQQKKAKALRKQKRADTNHLNHQAKDQILLALENESKQDHFQLKDFKRKGKAHIETLTRAYQEQLEPIQSLKQQRKKLSAKLQKQLHQSFQFLNTKLEKKALLDIFDEQTPPAGAGECAAPRLLQYAFQNQLKPLAMGEFWWGAPPQGQLRKHQQFYPACKSKCQPILGFMLQELDVEPNPISHNIQPQSFEILYEDDNLLVVNKPAGMLSVPGKNIDNSVQTQLQQKYPNLDIKLVHRLDMATSGIIIAAKSAKVYVDLQKQFTSRSVQKTYTAILHGIPRSQSGTINLPLRVDVDNRPMQMVCYQHGKKAITHYQVIDHQDNKAKILFYPHTGRTHQLRVHAAYAQGLNAPIVGDKLYGTPSERLYLHATSIRFVHPMSQKEIEIKCPAPF